MHLTYILLYPIGIVIGKHNFSVFHFTKLECCPSRTNRQVIWSPKSRNSPSVSYAASSHIFYYMNKVRFQFLIKKSAGELSVVFQYGTPIQWLGDESSRDGRETYKILLRVCFFSS